MPEDGWEKQYEKHDIIRLDCSRFIWPKYSFIRKCLKNYLDLEKLKISKYSENSKKDKNSKYSKNDENDKRGTNENGVVYKHIKEEKVKFDSKNDVNVRCRMEYTHKQEKVDSMYDSVTSHSVSKNTTSSSTHNYTTKNSTTNPMANNRTQIIKSEGHPNSSKNNVKSNSHDIGKKRTRDVIYSDEDTGSCEGSDDDQCGNALFFKVSTTQYSTCRIQGHDSISWRI
jgi:hypothetical protein